MTKGYKGLLILAVVWLLVAGLFFMTESAAVALAQGGPVL